MPPLHRLKGVLVTPQFLLTLLIVFLISGLSACTHHEQTVVSIPSPATVKSAQASQSVRLIPVQQILVEAPKAGEVLAGFAVEGQSMYGSTGMVALTNVFHASSDVTPLVLSALSSIFMVDKSSPYLAEVKLKPDYFLGRTGFWGVTGTASGRTKLSLKLFQNGKQIFKKNYAGVSMDEFSLLSSDFPPPEMVADLLQSSLAKAVKLMSEDRKLGEFRL